MQNLKLLQDVSIFLNALKVFVSTLAKTLCIVFPDFSSHTPLIGQACFCALLLLLFFVILTVISSALNVVLLQQLIISHHRGVYSRADSVYSLCPRPSLIPRLNRPSWPGTPCAKLGFTQQVPTRS